MAKNMTSADKDAMKSLMMPQITSTQIFVPCLCNARVFELN